MVFNWKKFSGLIFFILFLALVFQIGLFVLDKKDQPSTVEAVHSENENPKSIFSSLSASAVKKAAWQFWQKTIDTPSGKITEVPAMIKKTITNIFKNSDNSLSKLTPINNQGLTGDAGDTIAFKGLIGNQLPKVGNEYDIIKNGNIIGKGVVDDKMARDATNSLREIKDINFTTDGDVKIAAEQLAKEYNIPNSQITYYLDNGQQINESQISKALSSGDRRIEGAEVPVRVKDVFPGASDTQLEKAIRSEFDKVTKEYIQPDYINLKVNETPSWLKDELTYNSFFKPPSDEMPYGSIYQGTAISRLDNSAMQNRAFADWFSASPNPKEVKGTFADWLKNSKNPNEYNSKIGKDNLIFQENLESTGYADLLERTKTFYQKEIDHLLANGKDGAANNLISKMKTTAAPDSPAHADMKRMFNEISPDLDNHLQNRINSRASTATSSSTTTQTATTTAGATALAPGSEFFNNLVSEEEAKLQSLTQDGKNFTFDSENGRVTQTDENGQTKEIYSEWGKTGADYNPESAKSFSETQGQTTAPSSEPIIANGSPAPVDSSQLSPEFRAGDVHGTASFENTGNNTPKPLDPYTAEMNQLTKEATGMVTSAPTVSNSLDYLARNPSTLAESTVSGLAGFFTGGGSLLTKAGLKAVGVGLATNEAVSGVFEKMRQSFEDSPEVKAEKATEELKRYEETGEWGTFYDRNVRSLWNKDAEMEWVGEKMADKYEIERKALEQAQAEQRKALGLPENGDQDFNKAVLEDYRKQNLENYAEEKTTSSAADPHTGAYTPAYEEQQSAKKDQDTASKLTEDPRSLRERILPGFLGGKTIPEKEAELQKEANARSEKIQSSFDAMNEEIEANQTQTVSSNLFIPDGNGNLINPQTGELYQPGQIAQAPNETISDAQFASSQISNDSLLQVGDPPEVNRENTINYKSVQAPGYPDGWTCRGSDCNPEGENLVDPPRYDPSYKTEFTNPSVTASRPDLMNNLTYFPDDPTLAITANPQEINVPNYNLPSDTPVLYPGYLPSVSLGENQKLSPDYDPLTGLGFIVEQGSIEKGDSVVISDPRITGNLPYGNGDELIIPLKASGASPLERSLVFDQIVESGNLQKKIEENNNLIENLSNQRNDITTKINELNSTPTENREGELENLNWQEKILNLQERRLEDENYNMNNLIGNAEKLKSNLATIRGLDDSGENLEIKRKLEADNHNLVQNIDQGNTVYNADIKTLNREEEQSLVKERYDSLNGRLNADNIDQNPERERLYSEKETLGKYLSDSYLSEFDDNTKKINQAQRDKNLYEKILNDGARPELKEIFEKRINDASEEIKKLSEKNSPLIDEIGKLPIPKGDPSTEPTGKNEGQTIASNDDKSFSVNEKGELVDRFGNKYEGVGKTTVNNTEDPEANDAGVTGTNPFSQIKDIQTNPEAIQNDWESINEEMNSVENTSPQRIDSQTVETPTATPTAPSEQSSETSMNTQTTPPAKESSFGEVADTGGKPFNSQQDYDYYHKRLYGGNSPEIYGGEENPGLIVEEAFFRLASKGIDPTNGNVLDDASKESAKIQADFRQDQIEDLQTRLQTARDALGTDYPGAFEDQVKEVLTEKFANLVRDAEKPSDIGPEVAKYYSLKPKDDTKIADVQAPPTETGVTAGTDGPPADDTVQSYSYDGNGNLVSPTGEIFPGTGKTTANNTQGNASDTTLNSQPESKNDYDAIQNDWDGINNDITQDENNKKYQDEQQGINEDIEKSQNTNPINQIDNFNSVQNDWEGINEEIEKNDTPFESIKDLDVVSQKNYQGEWEAINNDIEKSQNEKSYQDDWEGINEDISTNERNKSYQNDWEGINQEIQNGQTVNRGDEYKPQEWERLAEKQNTTGQEPNSYFGNNPSTDYFPNPQGNNGEQTTNTPPTELPPIPPNVPDDYTKEDWESYLIKSKEEMKKMEENTERDRGPGDKANANANDNENNNENDNSSDENKDTEENKDEEEEKDEEE